MTYSNGKSILADKSFEFAVLIVNTCKLLKEEKKDLCYKSTNFKVGNFDWSKY